MNELIKHYIVINNIRLRINCLDERSFEIRFNDAFNALSKYTYTFLCNECFATKQTEIYTTLYSGHEKIKDICIIAIIPSMSSPSYKIYYNDTSRLS